MLRNRTPKDVTMGRVFQVQQQHPGLTSKLWATALNSQEASAGKMICTLWVYLTYLKKKKKEPVAELWTLPNQEHLQYSWAQRQRSEEAPSTASPRRWQLQLCVPELVSINSSDLLLLPSLHNRYSWGWRKWCVPTPTCKFPQIDPEFRSAYYTTQILRVNYIFNLYKYNSVYRF